jgi:hypothetical protein
MNKIEINLIAGDDNLVDVQATLAQAETDILAYKAARETEDDTIRQVLDGVFDSRPGVKMNMPFVIGQALNAMGIAEQPTNYKTLYERVHAHIVDNSQGKTDKGTKLVERPESYFVVGKGKGGGVARRADLNAVQASEAAAS